LRQIGAGSYDPIRECCYYWERVSSALRLVVNAIPSPLTTVVFARRTVSVAGCLAITAAAVSWGTIGFATAQLPAGTDARSVAVVRLLLSAPLLAALALLHRPSRLGRTVNLLQLRSGQGAVLSLSRVGRRGLVLAAGAVMVLYQLLYFTALTTAGTAIGSMATMGSVPVFGGLLAGYAARRLPSLRWLLSAVLTGLGCVLLTTVTPGTTGMSVPLGVACGFGAGLAYAAFTACCGAAIRRDARSPEPSGVMAAIFAVAAVLALPVLAAVDLSWLASPAGGLVAAYLALICTVGAYVLYGKGLRTTDVSIATALVLIEPATSVLIGILVLHETASPATIAGLLLIAAALTATLLPGRRPQPAPPPHRAPKGLVVMIVGETGLTRAVYPLTSLSGGPASGSRSSPGRVRQAV
jgi:DME family drug/metabolite transporter